MITMQYTSNLRLGLVLGLWFTVRESTRFRVRFRVELWTAEQVDADKLALAFSL